MEQSVKTKSAQSLETKGKVLKAAVELFNRHGSAAVTTHDIAQSAGISPGNLYYHFRNKQEIIRAVFLRMEIFSPDGWAQKSSLNSETRFPDFMRFYFGGLAGYRFFFREFSALLGNDRALAKLWHQTYDLLFSTMRQALAGWVRQGMLKPFTSQADEDIFIESVWILAFFSEAHLDLRRAPARGRPPCDPMQVLVRFLLPYHTEKGRRTIELYLN